jgi:hypothetical protein
MSSSTPASWEGDTGTLDEQFAWSDGTTSRACGRCQGSATAAIRAAPTTSSATPVGEVAGNALRWRYVLALPVDGKTWHVDFDDWMFLMDDKVMLNRSRHVEMGLPTSAK